jgi:hypothetical protein
MSDQIRDSENILSDASFEPVGVDGSSSADIDLSLLEDSLRLTPWQRLIENERALALVRMLERAKIREDGTS